MVPCRRSELETESGLPPPVILPPYYNYTLGPTAARTQVADIPERVGTMPGRTGLRRGPRPDYQPGGPLHPARGLRPSDGAEEDRPVEDGSPARRSLTHEMGGSPSWGRVDVVARLLSSGTCGQVRDSVL